MPLVRLIAPPSDPITFDEKIMGAGAPALAAAPTAASTPTAVADVGAVAIGYAAIAAGAALGILLWWWRNPAAFTPAAGISVFAPLYILAQSIERLIEPFTTLLKAAPAGSTAKVNKQTAVSNVNAAIVAQQADEAAKWQQVVDQIRRNSAVIAWGAASFLGIVACGALGIFLLRTIGFTSVPKQVDLVISGLAVGSGTKPLHDLITNLQSSAAAKQTPPDVQGT